jgi:hypothetical protein
MRTLALSLLAGAAVAVSGCGGHTSQPPGAQASAAGARTSPASSPRATAITELTSIGELRAQFNEQPDAPKLIVLMSPT